MPFKVTKGQGFSGLKDEVRVLRQMMADASPTLEQVVYPFVREHIRQQFATSGRHGGSSWDFSGEPIYKKFKTSLLGKNIGSKPLVWSQGDARLLPSLTEPGHPDGVFGLSQDGLVVGSNLPYASTLFQTGGTGPFDEPYPARDPFQMTPDQQRELNAEILTDLRRRLRHYHTSPTLL